MKSSFFSQFGQDEYLETHVFKGATGGFFVDVGAHNGITINNTLFFERNRGWTGLNIEPIKSVFDRLVINRPRCINLNLAVDDSNGTAAFIQNAGYTEMISGLSSSFDARHHARLTLENSTHGGETRVIEVETRRLDSICEEHGISRVHYLSVDVEGAEFNVIKSIDFEKLYIDVIGFEDNYADVSLPIVDFLNSRGYRVIQKKMDIFMIHESSEFA